MAAELRIIRRKKKTDGGPGPTPDQPASVHPLPHLLLGPLDHALVETIMAGMTREDRASFWRNHRDVLETALVERGLDPAVAEAILADHHARVRELHAERQKTGRRVRRYPIDFAEPPPLGTTLRVGRSVATLVAVEPFTRRDGQPSFLLRWDVAGRRATSGLRGQSLTWAKEADHDGA